MARVTKNYSLYVDSGEIAVYIKQHSGSTTDSIRRRALKVLRDEGIKYTGKGTVTMDLTAHFCPRFKLHAAGCYIEEDQ